MFNEGIDKYNNFIRDINDFSKFDLNINVFNFAHDDENKVIRYINNFADLKSRKKTIRLNVNENGNENFIKLLNNNNFGNSSKNEYNYIESFINSN